MGLKAGSLNFRPNVDTLPTYENRSDSIELEQNQIEYNKRLDLRLRRGANNHSQQGICSYLSMVINIIDTATTHHVLWMIISSLTSAISLHSNSQRNKSNVGVKASGCFGILCSRRDQNGAIAQLVGLCLGSRMRHSHLLIRDVIQTWHFHFLQIHCRSRVKPLMNFSQQYICEGNI